MLLALVALGVTTASVLAGTAPAQAHPRTHPSTVSDIGARTVESSTLESSTTSAGPPPSVGTSVVSTRPLARFGPVGGSDVTALAQFRLRGRNYLVVGGQISSYKSAPIGRFAIIDTSNGMLVYAAKSVNNFVQSLGVITTSTSTTTVYLGGDFTAVNGVGFHRAASFNVSSTAVGKLRVRLNTRWRPNVRGEVRSITTGGGRVFLGAWNLTAVNTSTGAPYWSLWTDCSVLATLYHGGSVYAGGISRTFGTFASHGAVKVNATTGKVNTQFRPRIANNPKRCTDPTATTAEIDGGANPISFAWDARENRLVEGDGGLINRIRSLNPTTGRSYWAHVCDGDAQTVTLVGPEVFVGFHRSLKRQLAPHAINGAMGAMLDARTGQQRIWQPTPDFTGQGDNDSLGNSLDHRNNGIITSLNTGTMLIMGGAFTSSATPAGHTKLIGFSHR
jgi:hypothetical protein